MRQASCILILLLLTVISCRKGNEVPSPSPDIESPEPPVAHVQSPWDSLDIAPYTPLAIKKEIYNWQQNFCLFADVYEHQFMDRTVYQFESGCPLESGSYVYDTSAVILCVLKSPDDLCLGGSFSEAGFSRMIWSNFEVKEASIQKVGLVNKKISAGERTYAQVKVLAGFDPRCAYERHEIQKSGNTFVLKYFYQTPKETGQNSGKRKELNINVEISPEVPGIYIIRSDSEIPAADTLVVE